MSSRLDALHCSDACRSKELVRSFGTCPECNQHWDGTAREHYRNRAWKICVGCSVTQCRCVVCGGKVGGDHPEGVPPAKTGQ